MGAGSSQLSAEQLIEIESRTHFTKKEVQRLYKRFRKLDRLQKGVVSRVDFQLIPEFAGNPLAERVLAVLDTNNDDVVTFEEFITAMSIFHPRADPMDKLHFTFRLYDQDDDGAVTPAELFSILKTFVASGFDDAQLQSVVDKLMEEFDTDGSGSLSFDEFSKLVTQTDLENKMTINL